MPFNGVSYSGTLGWTGQACLFAVSGFETLPTGHLETAASLSYACLPRTGASHLKMSKILFSNLTIRVRRISRYWGNCQAQGGKGRVSKILVLDCVTAVSSVTIIISLEMTDCFNLFCRIPRGECPWFVCQSFLQVKMVFVGKTQCVLLAT